MILQTVITLPSTVAAPKFHDIFPPGTLVDWEFDKKEGMTTGGGHEREQGTERFHRASTPLPVSPAKPFSRRLLQTFPAQGIYIYFHNMQHTQRKLHSALDFFAYLFFQGGNKASLSTPNKQKKVQISFFHIFSSRRQKKKTLHFQLQNYKKEAAYT